MRLSPLFLLLFAASCGHVGLDLLDDGGEGDAQGGAPAVVSPGEGGAVFMEPGFGGFPLSQGGRLGFDCPGDCGRVSDGLILLYDFEEGAGELAYDTSPVVPALNLSVPPSDAVAWVDSGLEIKGEVLLRSAVPALKLRDAVEATNELSLEAWVLPADPLQGGPARFFTVSEDGYQRNFTLAQEGGRLLARLRTTETTFNGMPDLRSPVVLSAELSHVVYTRAATGAEYLYLNGKQVAAGERPGSITNWTTSYHLGVADEFGEEPGLDRDWQGRIYLIAVYNRALSETEVVTNSRAGH